MDKPKRLDEIDENFKVLPPVVGDIEWIDAFDERLALRGLAWPCENREGRNFRRLPTRAEAGMNDGVKSLLHNPASVFVSFRTNSRKISVKMVNDGVSTMRHMPMTGAAGGELYMKDAGRWLPVATAIPDLTEATFEQELLKNLSGRTREYRFYLPLYMRSVSVEIGVEQGARVEPVAKPQGEKPIFFYGTSITQGGCASTAGGDFVSIVGRELDVEVVNFGFSGSGRGEAAVAELIREVDAEIFVLDYAANIDVEGADKTLPIFVKLLRERHPLTPIVIMSQAWFNPNLWNHERRLRDEGVREVFMDHYVRLRKSGDRNVYYIDGFGLLGPGVSGDYVDGVHPTSAGFAQMAQRLLPQLTAIRVINQDRLAGSAY